MEFSEIHFGGDNPKLHSYKEHYWQPGEKRLIEFYPNQIVQVTLLYSSDPSLYEKLSTLIDGKPISIDLELAQPINHSPHPIELFQFSSSNGTIIVASHENKGYNQIAKFLHSATFFGKGTSCDKKKLVKCLGERFDDIEDIEKTRLTPNGLPINFESLTQMFLGQGTAKFKDHKIQRSDLSVRPLTILQILYGAHDSYAMLQIYRKIIEKYGEEIKIDLNEKKVDCHFIDLEKVYPDNDNDDDDIDNDNDIDDINNIEKLLPKNQPSYKKQLFKIEQLKGEKVTDEDSCFLKYSDELISLLLPSQSEEKRNQVLMRICLAAELILRGFVSNRKGGKFQCNICFKVLKDTNALIQHCSSQHLNEDKESKRHHKFDSKKVLLHFLTAYGKVKCPFKFFFFDYELKKTAQEEEEEASDNDSYNDSDDDSDDDSDEESIDRIAFNKKFDKIQCFICNQKFTDELKLRDHCWINHFEFFVKLVTGKTFDRRKEEENKILYKFGVFCIKHLNLGKINKVNLSINCKLCDASSTIADKFFNHVFFRHQKFVLVNKKQYLNWPIRYNQFTPKLEKQAVPYINAVDYDELENCKIFNKEANKCMDCNVSFENDQERSDHYLENHLIFLPPNEKLKE